LFILFIKKFKQKKKTIPILVETNKNKHYEKVIEKRKFSPWLSFLRSLLQVVITMMTTTRLLQIIQSQELRQNSGPKYFSSSINKAELAVTLQGTGPFTIRTYQCSTSFLSAAGYASINDVPKLL
jgi:hypothetical protein